MIRVAAAVLAVTLLATGCADQQEKYCDAVGDHQAELGELLGDGSPDALLKALPVLRDLADEAPDDIRDEWRTVIDAVEGLQQALDDAGVDPEDFDGGKPPKGLSKEERQAIAQAADQVGSRTTEVALAGVQQQALDVCKTQLWL